MAASAAQIPPFDPLAPRNAFYRGFSSFLRTALGRGIAMQFSARVDPLLLRWTGGRLGTGLVFPSAALTTTGAKSGARRTAAVLYFTDGDDVILIASNFGTERHPAWYHNLKANPQAWLERGGVRAPYVAAEVSDPDEWERLFSLAQHIYPGYADYRRRTAAVGRRIPIMRLAPSPVPR